jgi:protein-tyrosine phosphatase
MDQITDQLWISDIQSVSESSTDHFDVVISTCQDTVEANVGCRYSHVPLADDIESEDEWGGDFSYRTFKEAVDKILSSLYNGDTVLVHCHRGRNRSVATSAAALAVYRGTTFIRELHSIQFYRPIADPNHIMRGYGKFYVANES